MSCFCCHSGATISGFAVNKFLLKMLPDGSEKSQLTSAWAIVFFGTIRGWYLGVRVYVLGRESP